MRHHNPLRQRGIGPSLTCRVGIGWIWTDGNPCHFLSRNGLKNQRWTKLEPQAI